MTLFEFIEAFITEAQKRIGKPTPVFFQFLKWCGGVAVFLCCLFVWLQRNHIINISDAVMKGNDPLFNWYNLVVAIASGGLAAFVHSLFPVKGSFSSILEQKTEPEKVQEQEIKPPDAGLLHQ